MLRVPIFLLISLILALPAQSQDLVTKPELIDQCLLEKKPQFHQSCLGVMASDCMNNNHGGDTTVGMGYCFDAELTVWDNKLNAIYKKLVRVETANDADAKSEGWNAPEKLPPLKEMQRKWISYRDALCDYEYSQWGGGTGGGPAIISCLASETGRQYLILKSFLSQGEAQ